ncbi:MAG: penicillin acylase family protein [Litorilinea sp.]
MLTTVIIAFIVTLVVLGLIVGGFLLYIYWWLVQKPAPDYDAAHVVDGMTAPVEIIRDKHAIPHIYAESEADLLRAQGFIHAQDRMWQMEQNRRIAQGRLAEVFGEPALEADRFSRIVGFARLAQAEWDALDAELQMRLQWYADGVNAYINLRKGKPAAEFNLLRFVPEPWQPVDSLALLKVMAWSQSINWESELLRLQLVSQLDPVRAAELEPEYPPENPIAAEMLDEGEVLRLLSASGLLLNKYDEIRTWLKVPQAGQGSNAWAIAPKASMTRTALLASDPHMSIQIPDIWYENHLVAPGLEVSGASYCGVPGVFHGHNAHIAWGVANANVDTQDLFVERRADVTPGGDVAGDTGETEFAFEYEDGAATATVHEENIVIRRRTTPHTERVVVTRHGPLISRFVGDDNLPDLALRWTGQNAGKTVGALLAMNRADSWDTFRVALQDWAAPALAFVYADDAGNIGYQVAGQVPVRAQSLGLTPAPGWIAKNNWQSYVPFAELPRGYNPEAGYIVIANQKLTGDDYPHFMGIEFDPGWRAQHLLDTFGKKDRFSMRDMENAQLDNTSKFALRLNKWLTTLQSEEPWEKVAIQELQKWNHRMDSESRAGLIFQYTHMALLEMVFGDKLGAAKDGYLGISRSPLFLIHGFAQRASIKLLELLDEHDVSVWYTDTQSGQSRTRTELLQQAMTRAVRQIRHDVSDSALRWNWGRIHQVRYVHPLGSVALFRRIFNRGPFPVGGDGTTVNHTGFAMRWPPGLVQSAAVYRQIFEVGSWERSQSVMMTGQSGHPLGTHYDDQMTMWQEGVYHAMPWARAEVVSAMRYRTHLQPGANASDPTISTSEFAQA